MIDPFDSLLDSLRRSRAFFWKHADLFSGDEWDYRVAPGTKTARETLSHLLVDDRAALEALRTGEEPDYDALTPEETDPGRLRELLLASHLDLLSEVAKRRADETINVWGNVKPQVEGIAWYASEDFYHAGQLALIRLALHPDWEYYPQIYGD